MKLGILKEINDPRVAVIPATLPKLQALGVEILVEKGAGSTAHYHDDNYSDHASLHDRATIVQQADILLSIYPIPEAEWKKVKPDALLIAQFEPFNDTTIVDRLNEHNLRAFSMDMIPRTTLAQSMDVLSSMASIAGYKAVLEGARLLPRYLPMMITAAGSIRPAQVLVLGAGVAGLQAIATARRLGAMVEAFDTRAAAKEEVLSLGAKFVEVKGATDDTGAGGYAVAQSEDFLKRQRAEVQARAMKSDIVITTAQVRGRKAPLLVPKSTLDQMKPGSVVVDLAASTGGNCEVSENNKVITYNGITVLGNSQLAALMPQDASQLYSNNVLNFLKFFIKEGQLELDFDQEIISGAYITEKPTPNE
ncbi:MAG: NAD(P) transhydrogenase subunit alpha [Bacteroidota bacterium]